MTPKHLISFCDYCQEMGVRQLSDEQFEEKYAQAVSFLFWTAMTKRVTLKEIDAAIRGHNCSEHFYTFPEAKE